MSTASSSSGEAQANSVQEFSTELLRIYYSRLFPYDSLFNWLSYGNDVTKENPSIDRDFFFRREWSFTIEDDIYIRYQCFRDKAEMMDAIRKRQPHKIDIGAVFSAAPKDHTTIKPELFKTVERELVFDIDMTDYDNIRTCCSGAAICRRCWPYMTMALKVVDRALRDDFAFKHILWIYSGRRGIHCWVSDPEARALSNEVRAAVVEYLSVSVGTADNSDKKLKSAFSSERLHPSLRRAYDILEPYFERCIADGQGQGLLARKDKYMKVLNSMPNDTLRKEIYEAWEEDSLTGAQRWQIMKDVIMQDSGSSSSFGGGGGGLQQQQKKRKVDYRELDMWRHELVFTHCYPRLDANVSKSQNHLLKSPFCVHPKTGRVCVPIDPVNADAFDPFSVPTVRTLCLEVDAYDNAHKHESDFGEVTDIDKTSMKAAVELFDRSFMNKMWTTIRAGFREKSEKMAAMQVDF